MSKPLDDDLEKLRRHVAANARAQEAAMQGNTYPNDIDTTAYASPPLEPKRLDPMRQALSHALGELSMLDCGNEDSEFLECPECQQAKALLNAPAEPKRPDKLVLVADILLHAEAINRMIFRDPFVANLVNRRVALAWIETHFEAGLRAIKALREEMKKP